MYTADFGIILFFTIFFLLFNPIMTTVFLVQRFKGLWNWISPTFIGIAILITFLQFALADGSSWALVYATTITTLTIGDRIVKRRKLKKLITK